MHREILPASLMLNCLLENISNQTTITKKYTSKVDTGYAFG